MQDMWRLEANRQIHASPYDIRVVICPWQRLIWARCLGLWNQPRNFRTVMKILAYLTTMNRIPDENYLQPFPSNSNPHTLDSSNLISSIKPVFLLQRNKYSISVLHHIHMNVHTGHSVVNSRHMDSLSHQSSQFTEVTASRRYIETDTAQTCH